MDPEPRWRTISHPLLRELFEELMQGSPTFRAAMDRIDAQGFPVRVGTVADLEEINRPLPKKYRVELDPRFGAVSAYNPGGDGSVYAASAFFDLDKIHEATRSQPNMPVDSARARVAVRDALIHELYGHLAPIAKAGNVSGAARDPKRGERYERSPVGRRENAIRRELGLQPRTKYGLLD